MTFTPCRAHRLLDRRELQPLLFACQEKSFRTGCPLTVSLSQEIAPLDPLAVLQTMACASQAHFYWENRSQNCAIAALGMTASLTVDGHDRFAKAQQFVQTSLKQIIQFGDTHVPGSNPNFFCYFTFFDSPVRTDSPFPSATVVLHRWQITRQQERCVLVTNITVDSNTDLDELIEQLAKEQRAITQIKSDFIDLKINPPSALITKNNRNANHFKTAVKSALNSIQADQLSKIVLAHTLDVTSPLPFQTLESLNYLRQRYPGCYVFSVSNGQGKTFIGASPERLVSIQNHQLVTDALAGSAPRGNTTGEDVRFADRLLKSEKEQREHAAVSQFIMQRLRQIGLTPTRSPLQLLQLSNIQHLWTPIQAFVPRQIHPLEIVSQLHPTPAVAGVPTEIACEQIRCYEPCDRSLYAAPIGRIDSQGNCEFVVGIRSAMIETNRARLYAGAGIVAGSDADKELAEVQLKLQTMLKALV